MLKSDVFFNRERSGYEELKSYQPLWWSQILEMRANNAFAGYTLEQMADALEQMVKDQFFDTCSEYMLERVELWMGLTGYGAMTIEERRNLVKASWIGNQKVNRSSIQALVMAYCGCSSEVHFTNEVVISANITESTSYIYLGNLKNVLSRQIPAHISWDVIMNIESRSVAYGNSVCYWVYTYDKCGTIPDISTLGDAIDTDIQVKAKLDAFTYESPKCATEDAGVLP
jgi:hypothetical protein